MGDLVAVEAELRRMHESMCRSPREPLLRALRAGVRHAGQPPFVPGDLWLVCTARLLGEFADPVAIDSLIEVLGSASPEARVEAGEQLQGLSEAHFASVAAGAARALGRLAPDHAALLELPYVLAETTSPLVVSTLAPWLGHANADVVGAAIEALAAFGDPAARSALAPLRGDPRTSRIASDEDASFEATVGELASEALDLLDAVAEAEGGDEQP